MTSHYTLDIPQWDHPDAAALEAELMKLARFHHQPGPVEMYVGWEPSPHHPMGGCLAIGTQYWFRSYGADEAPAWSARQILPGGILHPVSVRKRARKGHPNIIGTNHRNPNLDTVWAFFNPIDLDGWQDEPTSARWIVRRTFLPITPDPQGTPRVAASPPLNLLPIDVVVVNAGMLQAAGWADSDTVAIIDTAKRFSPIRISPTPNAGECVHGILMPIRSTEADREAYTEACKAIGAAAVAS